MGSTVRDNRWMPKIRPVSLKRSSRPSDSAWPVPPPPRWPPLPVEVVLPPAPRARRGSSYTEMGCGLLPKEFSQGNGSAAPGGVPQVAPQGGPGRARSASRAPTLPARAELTTPHVAVPPVRALFESAHGCAGRTPPRKSRAVVHLRELCRDVGGNGNCGIGKGNSCFHVCDAFGDGRDVRFRNGCC